MKPSYTEALREYAEVMRDASDEPEDDEYFDGDEGDDHGPEDMEDQ